MAKVAHSAIIIQKAFRIYKKKKLEGKLRKGVVKVNIKKVKFVLFNKDFLFILGEESV